jgi:hypothetical protein
LVAHQGHVYFCTKNEDVSGLSVCVELTTGKIVGELRNSRSLAPDVGGSVAFYCPGFAMGDRLFMRAERGCFLVYQTAGPNRPFKFLERDMSDCFAFGPLGAAVDGRVYVRGIGWIECWDLRANPKAPSDSLKTWSLDPAVEKCDVPVSGLGSPFMNDRNAAVKGATQLPASNVRTVAPTIAQLIKTGKYTTAQAASAALVALAEKAADAAATLSEAARGAVEGGKDQRAGLAWQALAAVDSKTAIQEIVPYLKRQDEQAVVALRALRLAPKLSVLCLEDLGTVLATEPLTDVAAEAIAEVDPKAATVVLPQVATAIERRQWKLTRPLALVLIRVAPAAEGSELEAVNKALTKVLATRWTKKDDRLRDKEDTQFFDMACDILTVMGPKAVGTVPALVERLPNGAVNGALSAIGPKAISVLEARLGREKNDRVKGDIRRILDGCRNKKTDEKSTDEKDDK